MPNQSIFIRYIKTVFTGYVMSLSQAAIHIILIPILYNLLGSQEYGIFVLQISLFMIANLFLEYLKPFHIRLLADGPKEEFLARKEFWMPSVKKEFFQSSAWACLGLIAVDLIYFSLVWDGIFEISKLTLFMLCSCVTLFLQIIFCFLSVRLISMNRQRNVHIAGFLTHALTFGLIYIYTHLDAGIIGIMGILAFCTLCGVIFQVLYIWAIERDLKKTIGKPPNIPLNGKIKFFKSRLFALGASLRHSDIALVAFLGGPEIAAVFAIFWRVGEGVIHLFARLTNSLQPFLYELLLEKQSAKIKKIYSISCGISFFLSFSAGISFWLFANMIIKFISGHDRIIIDPYSLLLFAAAIALVCSSRFFESIALYLGHYKKLTWLVWSDTIFRLTFVIVAFEKFSSTANILAIIISYFLMTLYLFYFSRNGNLFNRDLKEIG